VAYSALKSEQIMNKPLRHPLRTATAPAGTTLGRAAERLLAGLGRDGAYAFPDPLDPATLILRAGATGVSLGAGRFPAEAARSLVAADLAEERGPRRHLVLSAAGRARLRRQGAEPETGYRAQHLELTEERDGPVRRLRDAAESPIAWMVRRRGSDGQPLLDAASFEAGERLRRDLTTAQMTPRMGVDWGAARVDGSGPRDPASASDAVVAARQRVRAALDAVGGELSGLLIDLCGHLMGLERIEAERRWPARSAKVVARIALARLAAHYGLERQATGPETARMRLWREG
jgi:hypothetical protein